MFCTTTAEDIGIHSLPTSPKQHHRPRLKRLRLLTYKDRATAVLHWRDATPLPDPLYCRADCGLSTLHLFHYHHQSHNMFINISSVFGPIAAPSFRTHLLFRPARYSSRILSGPVSAVWVIMNCFNGGNNI